MLTDVALNDDATGVASADGAMIIVPTAMAVP